MIRDVVSTFKALHSIRTERLVRGTGISIVVGFSNEAAACKSRQVTFMSIIWTNVGFLIMMLL